MFSLILLAGSLWGFGVPARAQAPDYGADLFAICGRGVPADRSPTPETDRFTYCIQTATFVLMEFSRDEPGSNEEGGDLMFCPPRSSAVSVENVGPLIDAYLVQYRRDNAAFARMQPVSAFLRAMRRQWPCRGGR